MSSPSSHPPAEGTAVAEIHTAADAVQFVQEYERALVQQLRYAALRQASQASRGDWRGVLESNARIDAITEALNHPLRCTFTSGDTRH